MCQFKSGIITKKDVLWLLDEESHEEIIKANKLNDKTNNPDFVRVEMLPVDGNIFNHKPENWKLKVDQDYKPDWFSEKEADVLMRVPLKKTFDERFIIYSKIKRVLTNGRCYIKDSSNVEALGSSRVVAWGSSRVVASGSSSVEARGSSRVEAWDSSSVVARDSSSVEAWDSSSVVARDRSSVVALGSSRVEAWGSSSVVARDSSSVEAWDSSVKWKLNNNGIAIIRYEDVPRIVVANKIIKLELQK